MVSRLCTSIVFLIFFFNQQVVFSSPVLLWTNTIWPNENSVALSTLSPIDLISKSICQLPTEQIQLEIFAVDRLTHQQIQRGAQSQHPILTDAKVKGEVYRYFPDVRGDVFKAFTSIDRSNNYQCSQIRFGKPSTRNFDSLSDALDAMDSKMKNVDNQSNRVIVIALIASSVENSMSETRVRREIEKSENDLIINDGCMFYADQLYSEWKGKKSNFTLDLDQSSCQVNDTESAVLELVWTDGMNDTEPIEMTFYVLNDNLYWKLDKVVFNNSEYRYFAYGMHSLMETPPKFSYVCTTATFVQYNSGTYGTYDFQNRFFISKLQFQPFNANSTQFGPPNYCTSFFTSGIWMGITSSLLCLGILLFGIRQMMSIKTNDRYDDPKGKPLVIKAQE